MKDFLKFKEMCGKFVEEVGHEVNSNGMLSPLKDVNFYEFVNSVISSMPNCTSVDEETGDVNLFYETSDYLIFIETEPELFTIQDGKGNVVFSFSKDDLVDELLGDLINSFMFDVYCKHNGIE